MPAIRVIDRETGSPKRRSKLWETFGLVGVNPTELKDGKGVYYAIIKQNQIETLITEDVKHTFRDNNFEITTPIEYDSLRSVIINHIDKAILDYTDNEVVESIHCANEWAKVLEICRIPTTGRLLKVKFESTEMAQYAINNGIVVLHQKINSKNVEREIFVRISPCYNCYQYTHKTRDCPAERKTLCSYCAAAGHKHNECTSKEPRCINCGGKHRTLAASCKVRRDLIKEKTKEIRTRSRSQSRNRVTYAQAAVGGGTIYTDTQNTQGINVNKEGNNETKLLITKIITSIAFSHYMEALNPGSFQNNMNEMFKLNGIPQIQFPKQIVTENIIEIYKDSLKEHQSKETQDPRDKGDNRDQTTNLSMTDVMEVESQKRGRESNDFSETIGKKKKDALPSREIDKQTQEYPLPKPISDRSRPATAPTPLGASGGGSSSGMGRDGGDKPKPKEQRDTSLSRSKINVKDIGIVVYFKKSSRYIIDMHNQERREILRDAILRGEARIQWRHPKVAYEAIYNGIVKRFINIEDISITKLPDKDFEKMKTMCIQQQS